MTAAQEAPSPIKPIGSSPATLLHVGPRRTEEVHIQITDYCEASVETSMANSMAEIPALPTGRQRWIQVCGLHEPSEIEAICVAQGVHPLVIEDILNTKSMPKIEDFDSHIFVSARIPVTGEHEHEIETQQVSFLFTGTTTITFLEEPSDLYQPLIHRLSIKGSRIRTRGTDYFAWAVLDVIADTILAFAERLEQQLETIEDSIADDQILPELSTVHGARREVAKLHRMARPFRDIASHFLHSESTLLERRNKPFYQDLIDHALQAVELIDFLREHASSLRELYYTTNSHRMNEVMKILASFSAIFLPLTFIAGLYGMNFEVMPELHWRWSYPVLLVVFASIALFLVRLFKRRGWF